jgi:hypothetical protein
MTCAKKKRPPPGGLSEIQSCFDQAAAIAAPFFRSLRQLADDRTAPVGEDHGRTSLDHSWGACGHNVGAKIEFALRS